MEGHGRQLSGRSWKATGKASDLHMHGNHLHTAMRIAFVSTHWTADVPTPEVPLVWGHHITGNEKAERIHCNTHP